MPEVDWGCSCIALSCLTAPQVKNSSGCWMPTRKSQTRESTLEGGSPSPGCCWNIPPDTLSPPPWL